MNYNKSIKTTHDNCMAARGFSFFKCIKCGEKSSGYVNGIDICIKCCNKDNICRICGKKLDLNNNDNKKIKVFLGGTCNGSSWREELINKLDDKVVDYFNPVVKDWTPECMEEELKQRELCDYCLYVITSRMTGVYSIAEVVDDSNKRPNKTIFCYLSEDSDPMQNLTSVTLENLKFTDGEIKSLNQVAKMVKNNGGKVFSSLEEIATYLNTVGKIKKVLPRLEQEVIETIINLAKAEVE